MMLNLSWNRALGSLLALWMCGSVASAQGWEKGCCNIISNPSTPQTAFRGQSVIYDLDVDFGRCQIGDLQWTLEALTPDLNMSNSPPAPVTVAVGLGAIEDSRWRAHVRNVNPITQATICQGARILDIHVPDGSGQEPDLMTTALSAGGAQQIAGQPFDVTAVIQNEGDVGTGVFYNRLFINNVAQSTRPCGPLTSTGTCDNQRWTVTLDEGLHELKVCADTFNQEDESDENNNCRVKPVGVADPYGPDLVPTRIVSEPAVIQEGESGTIYVDVTNQGNQASGSFVVSVGAPFGATPPYREVTFLGVGETRTLEFSWTGVVAGPGTIEAWVDHDNDKSDFDEDNNRRTNTVEILENLPDFYVGVNDITMEHASPYVGQTVRFTVRVQNRGLEDWYPGPPLAVDVELAEYSERFFCDDPMPINGECEISFFYRFLNSGAHQLVVRLDLDERHRELLEDNNIRFLNFNVGGGPEVRCQGTWELVQTYPPVPDGEDPPTFISQGSVRLNPQGESCFVYFGQNVPVACWRTVAPGDLEATWAHDGDCPVSVDVTDTTPIPDEDSQWSFDVYIY